MVITFEKLRNWEIRNVVDYWVDIENDLPVVL